MAMLYGAANSAELAKEIADATLAGNWRATSVNVTKAGLEFPCQMTSTLIRDDSGAPIGIAECWWTCGGSGFRTRGGPGGGGRAQPDRDHRGGERG